MYRHVSIRRPVNGALVGWDSLNQQKVSALDLPPAFAYHIDMDGKTRWITDPVELSLYIRRNPSAVVTVCEIERMRQRRFN